MSRSLTSPRHLDGSLTTLDTGWFAKKDMFRYARSDTVEFAAGGDAFLEFPRAIQPPLITSSSTQKFQQFRVALGYGGLNKRGFSAASSFGIDAETHLLQFATAQTSYNWDCCGMTVEYRRYAIATVRNENLFRFTFTLANIGSLGNLRRQERLY